jgi:hypothetical protein
MSKPNLKALNKLLKTLSAVRTTLSDEERAILDQLILDSKLNESLSKNPEEDVSAHAITSQIQSSGAVFQIMLRDNGYLLEQLNL